MKAFCPVCSAGYPIPDDKVKEKGLPVKCKRCGAVFRVFADDRESIVQSEPTVPETEWKKAASAKPAPAKKSAAREAAKVKKVVKSTAIDETPETGGEEPLPMKEEIPLPSEPEPAPEVTPEPEPEEPLPVAEAEALTEDDSADYAEVEAEEIERSMQADFDMPPRLGKKDFDADIEDDDFLKIDHGSSRKVIIGAVIVGALAVVALIILSIVRESGEVYETVQKRQEAAQIAYENSKKKLDYLHKFQQGMRALNAGSAEAYQLAAEWFDKSLAAKAEYVPALAGKADALALMAIEYDKKEGVEEACKLAEEARAKNEKAPEAARALASCLLAQKKLDDADKAVQQALTLVEGDSAEDANSNYLLALLYLQKKDLSKTIYTLKSVIALNPLHFRAHHLLADVYATRKAWQLALDSENKALSMIPNHVEAKRRAELYAERVSGKLRETDLVPGMPAEMGSNLDKKATADALLKRIRSAMRRGSTNEALGLINQLLKLGKYTGTAYMLKCRALLNSGNRSAALDACSVARNYNPDAYYYLGAIYEAMGNKSMKETNYNAYLRARPNGSHAAEVRSILGKN